MSPREAFAPNPSLGRRARASRLRRAWRASRSGRSLKQWARRVATDSATAHDEIGTLAREWLGRKGLR